MAFRKEKNTKTNFSKISIGIASPEEILEKSIKGGVKGVWNFAPVDLRSNDKIEVQNVHLSDSLLTLSFRINEKEFLKNKK